MASSPEILRVEDLAKHYQLRGSNSMLKAVDGISFGLRRGETLGIVGESGCGKSTTARLLVRLEQPTAGSVTLAGQDIASLSGAALRQMRRRIQMVFQDPFSSLNPRLIRDRLIDFIRVHISDIGGLTPARKLATMAEYFGVRTAWHGPGDTSPIGHAANLQLDLNCSNFGIQEATLFDERTREVFPGCPEIRDGAMWSNERPGLGVDIDERLAAKFPYPEHEFNGAWPEIRRKDGTVIRP